MYFSNIQVIYNFLSTLPCRWAILKKHLKDKLVVNPLSETRWESQIDAVRPFLYAAGEIYNALYEISPDVSFDLETRSNAESLGSKMKTISFCFCTIICHKILNQVNVVSKILQNINTDVSEAVQHL